MNKLSLCCLILFCLINTVLAQNFGSACSVYCRACNSSKNSARFGACVSGSGQLCPTSFISSGAA